PIRQLVFAPGGKTLLARSSDQIYDDGGEIQLFKFNYNSGKPVLEPLGNPIWRAKLFAFSPNGQVMLIRAGNDLDEIGYRLWHTTTGRPLGEPLHWPGQQVELQEDLDVPLPCFERDGKTIRISRFGKVYRFAVNIPCPSGPLGKSTNPLDYLPIGQMISPNPDHQRAGQVRMSPPHRGHVTGIPGSANDKIMRWDDALGKQLGAPLSYGGGKEILGPHFSPDGRKLLTLGDFAQLWDAATHKPIGAAIPN